MVKIRVGGLSAKDESRSSDEYDTRETDDAAQCFTKGERFAENEVTEQTGGKWAQESDNGCICERQILKRIVESEETKEADKASKRQKLADFFGTQERIFDTRSEHKCNAADPSNGHADEDDFEGCHWSAFLGRQEVDELKEKVHGREEELGESQQDDALVALDKSSDLGSIFLDAIILGPQRF